MRWPSNQELPYDACYLLLNSDNEGDTVGVIKRHLLTAEQWRKMSARTLSIEDLLNGRVEGDQGIYDEVFGEWNAKLGRKLFGF